MHDPPCHLQQHAGILFTMFVLGTKGEMADKGKPDVPLGQQDDAAEQAEAADDCPHLGRVDSTPVFLRLVPTTMATRLFRSWRRLVLQTLKCPY
jgi:hypothetical protein